MMKQTFAAFAFAVLALGSARTEAAYTPSPGLASTGSPANGFAGSVGVNFTTSAASGIDGVGIYNGNGSFGTATVPAIVTLFDVTTNSQVFSVVVTPGNPNNVVSGNFLFTPITGLPSLVAGQSYTLTEMIPAADFFGAGGTVTGVNPLTVTGTTINGAAFFEPVIGANLSLNSGTSASVPEPSSLILMGIGAVSLVAGGALRRKSVKASV